jgi:uncharacterized protein YehS (DUF1456 family)
MTNNTVLRGIRYLLNVPDAKLREITALTGTGVRESEMHAYLKKEEEEGYVECPDQVMAKFLDGLILFKRGRDENRPLPPVEIPITNNIILKKLRVAFELKDTDIIALVQKAGLNLSKTELSAFFRQPEHRNYRECHDQYLRNIIKGLTPNVST